MKSHFAIALFCFLAVTVSPANAQGPKKPAHPTPDCPPSHQKQYRPDPLRYKKSEERLNPASTEVKYEIHKVTIDLCVVHADLKKGHENSEVDDHSEVYLKQNETLVWTCKGSFPAIQPFEIVDIRKDTQSCDPEHPTKPSAPPFPFPNADRASLVKEFTSPLSMGPSTNHNAIGQWYKYTACIYLRPGEPPKTLCKLNAHGVLQVPAGWTPIDPHLIIEPAP